MLTSNPFAELSASLPPSLMQTYVIVMILLVMLGTLFDIIHKKSARYFFDHWRNTSNKGTRQVDGGEIMSIAVQTAMIDVMTSGEFCSTRRRIAHLLTMYGFVAYVLTSVILVFAYPRADDSAPGILAALWHVGAIMVCVGGYWFWFFIRVDVASEGNSPFRMVRADLFVVSLVVSVTLALIWAYLQSTSSTTLANVLLTLYLLATTVLFGSIPWSKFSHMFFKPAAAFQKRLEQANGSRRNLPRPADRAATFGDARQRPNHF